MNTNDPKTLSQNASSADDGSTASNTLLEEQLARTLERVPPLVRLPAPGKRCPFTQLSRSRMAELVTPTFRNRYHPPVRAIYQRAHKHAQRGVWLIPAENLFRYLLARMDSSSAEYLASTKARTRPTAE